MSPRGGAPRGGVSREVFVPGGGEGVSKGALPELTARGGRARLVVFGVDGRLRHSHSNWP